MARDCNAAGNLNPFVFLLKVAFGHRCDLSNLKAMILDIDCTTMTTTPDILVIEDEPFKRAELLRAVAELLAPFAP
jgi:hypothetical protein